MPKKIRLGMIGGGQGAFIGAVHRIASRIDDRYELLAASTAALISRIPIGHIHGGETTIGAFDEAIRHSITKMSHLHFTSIEEYRDRVIQLGENPKTVFNVGEIGLENIKDYELITKNELENDLGFKLNKRNVLITVHPSTLEHNPSKIQFGNLLYVLSKQKNTKLIFTRANSDTFGQIINQMIKYPKTPPIKELI